MVRGVNVFKDPTASCGLPCFYAGFSLKEFKALNGWKDKVPEYVKDYISVNTFM
jgi:hypothetical protein